MKRILLAFLAVTVVAAGSAQGSPLVTVAFSIEVGGGWVGLDGLRLQVAGFEVRCQSSDASAVALCNQFPDAVELDNYTITGGALVDVSTVLNQNGFGYDVYMFETGFVEADLSWKGADGLKETGHFTAPVYNLVTDAGTFLQSRVSVCYPFCGSDAPLTNELFRLGAGLFDGNLARRLGVSTHTLGGRFTNNLEDLEGDATTPKRFGPLNNPTLRIDAVPEPGMSMLALGGLAAVLMRRRRYRS